VGTKCGRTDRGEAFDYSLPKKQLSTPTDSQKKQDDSRDVSSSLKPDVSEFAWNLNREGHAFTHPKIVDGFLYLMYECECLTITGIEHNGEMARVGQRSNNHGGGAHSWRLNSTWLHL